MPIPRLPARAAPLAALLAVIAGCVPAPRPAPPPPRPAAPPPAAPPPAPLAADWQDWPVTPGTWRYERDARGSRALFGMPGADARAVLRCDRAERRMFLSRAGTAATPITVRTTSTTRSLAARPSGATPPYAAVALSPTDPLLDAIAFTRGRFTLEQAGTAPLVLPPWSEVSRVIEDCRG